MPPRVTKEPTAATEQTVRHNGQREAKKKVVIAEEQDESVSEDESDSAEEEEAEDSQRTSQSQSQDDNQLEKLITDMMQAVCLQPEQ